MKRGIRELSTGEQGTRPTPRRAVDTVRGVVDGATSAISKNEFHAVNERNALGLPA